MRASPTVASVATTAPTPSRPAIILPSLALAALALCLCGTLLLFADRPSSRRALIPLALVGTIIAGLGPILVPATRSVWLLLPLIFPVLAGWRWWQTPLWSSRFVLEWSAALTATTIAWMTLPLVCAQTAPPAGITALFLLPPALLAVLVTGSEWITHPARFRQPPSLAVCIVAAATLTALALGVARLLELPGFVPPGEEALRLWLETHLPVRPRFKEVVFLAVIAVAWPWRRRSAVRLCIWGAVVLLTGSVWNSILHLHIPAPIRLARLGSALLAAAPLAILLRLFLLRILADDGQRVR